MHEAIAGQTVLVLGGSAGIGLAVAQAARGAGAEVILTARNPRRLEAAASAVGATSFSAFDAYDHDALAAFFAGLTDVLDHVFVATGSPYYGALADLDLHLVGEAVTRPVVTMLDLARLAPPHMRPGGTLVFMSGTAARLPGVGLTVPGAVIAATTATVKNLALELDGVRINSIAAGFVDTPLSARLLGDGLDARRRRLRDELPIRRVVGPADIAGAALFLMGNTAITGAIVDVDGGQQLLANS